MPAVQELREDVCDAMRSWTDSLPQERFNQVTQSLAWDAHQDNLHVQGLVFASRHICIQTHAQQAKEMQDDPARVETYGQHFSWHEYWSWAKKPGTYGTFANISSFCRMRDISVDVYAQEAGRKVCIWQERANADDAAAGPICLLRTGNHFDLLVRP